MARPESKASRLSSGAYTNARPSFVREPCIDIRDEERIKNLLGIPEGYKAVSILSIGHQTRPHKPRPRLPINELVFTEKWGDPYYKEPK